MFAPSPWLATAVLAVACSPEITSPPTAHSREADCISGPNASVIQQALDAGRDAVLCQDTVFTSFEDTLHFRKNDQAIYTIGYPDGGRRAVLRLPPGPALTTLNCAINGRTFSRVKVKSIEIDGNRIGTDPYARQPDALMKFGGGGSVGVEIDRVRAYHPKGWSILHVSEDATGAKITNNHFGPAGHEFPSVWADGISIAASGSEIIGNVIDDPTDGGIVVFGAPGTKVIGNTVRSKTRSTLGLINLIDYEPFQGDFTGVVVSRNSIVAQGALAKIGIAMGPRSWYCPGDVPWAANGINRGGTVTDNLAAGNRMGYALAVHGVREWTIGGNSNHALYRGTAQSPCGRNPAPAFQLAHRSDGPFEGFTSVDSLQRLYNLTDSGPVSYALDSELVDQMVPDVMEAGRRYSIRVGFKNTGTSAWRASESHRLGALNPRDNSSWGMGRVDLDPGATIAPGQTQTFRFDVIAPTTPGKHHMLWGMLQEGARWFGDVSNNVVIEVRPPTVGSVVAVSAASFVSDRLAPDSIAVLYGSDLAIRTEQASTQPLPTELAGTVARIVDAEGQARDAGLFFVSPGQLNVLVPSGVSLAGRAEIRVTSATGILSRGSFVPARIAPGLFSASANGTGVAAGTALRIKADGSQSHEPLARFDTTQNRYVPVPIALGPPGERVFLVLYGTGFRNKVGIPAPVADFGGLLAAPQYVGPSGLLGTDQVNVEVSRQLAGRGEIPLRVSIDGIPTNVLTVAVE